MAEKTKQSDILTTEVYELMRALVTAIRIVKIYPPNNPVYSQTVKEAHEALSRFWKKNRNIIGVQKTFFTYLKTPIGKETETNKPIAQDYSRKASGILHSVKVLLKKRC